MRRDPNDLDESDEEWWERVSRKRKEKEEEGNSPPREKAESPLPRDFRFTHFLHGGKE